MGLSNSVHLRRGGDEASDGGGAVTNKIEVTKSAGSDAVTINIRRSNATKFAVQVSLNSSVESFKSLIAETIHVPVEQQHLVYKGWLLKDDRTLKTYGLKADHTVHLVGGLLPAESNNTSNTIEEVQQRSIQNPSVNMTPITMYNLLNNSDAMREWAMNSYDYKRIRDSPQLSVVNKNAILPRIVNNLIYYVFFWEITRAIYISRGGGGDVITLLMENPTTSHMLHSLLSNLESMNWRLDPRLREKTQNPVVNRQLTSPETIQQSLSSKRRRLQSTGNAGEMDRETVGPEELYASQLAQLTNMGFCDRRKNLEALIATGGNVRKAIYHLLGLK